MWHKIKLWTRIILLSALTIYTLIFVIYNFRARVEPDIAIPFWRTFEKPGLLVVLLCVSALSIVCWSLAWRIYGIVKQIRNSRASARADRLEREVADMKVKAAMLQTKPTDPG